MSEQDNVKITRKQFDYLNNHNLMEGLPFFADDVSVEATGSPVLLDKEKGRLYTQNFINAFPDLHFDIRDIVAQGNLVAVTWRARGTQKAVLNSLTGDTIPPTNRKVEVPGVTIYEFRDGKIVRQQIYFDQLAIFQQLGLVTDLAQMMRTQR